MTRKDFVFLADVITNLAWGLDATEQRYVAESFANRLPETNGAFDRKRFLAACGVDDAPKITASDVDVTVGIETIECAALIDASDTSRERVRFRYSGYTKKEAVAEFVAGVNSGEIR